MKISGKECYNCAELAADWMINTQVGTDMSADKGRYIYTYKPADLESDTPASLGSNWMIGCTVLSMLMMYKRSGDKKYLESAGKAVKYLFTLQILDTRNIKNFGMIRENTPQSEVCHPRDGLSAAWALLHYGITINDSECIERAVIFAEWFTNYAIKDDYPAWTFYTENKEPLWQLGSFHGGSPLFFMDLYKHTNNEKWLVKTALPILDRYRELFIKNDNSIIVELTPDKKNMMGKHNSALNSWQYMHTLNDDFTALAMMRAYKETGNRRFLDTALNFLNRAITQQNKDGSFGTPPVPSASGSLIMELLDAGRITGEKKYTDAAQGASGYLASLQETKIKDKRVYGGIYGQSGEYKIDRSTLNIRTSSYFLAAMLKMENNMEYNQYTA